jgi:hypothetical protein
MHFAVQTRLTIAVRVYMELRAMARRRQQRRREKERRHAPSPVAPPIPMGGLADEPAERLFYSREQAAQALGISLATLDRRVIPTIATIKTEWGARLIPAAEFNRHLAERTEQPRKARRHQPTGSGRKSKLPAEVVARIRDERARGRSLADIACRLNRDAIPTGQGGRQWWPSTVRDILCRSAG